jgi:hypothetical protein
MFVEAIILKYVLGKMGILPLFVGAAKPAAAAAAAGMGAPLAAAGPGPGGELL